MTIPLPKALQSVPGTPAKNIRCVILLLFVYLLFSQTAQAQNVGGSTSVNIGETHTYYYYGGYQPNVYWYVNGGDIVSQSDSYVEVYWTTPGAGSVYFTYTDYNWNYYEDYLDVNVGGQAQNLSGSTTVNQWETHTYYYSGGSHLDFDWDVYGGNIVSESDSHVEIQWTTSGWGSIYFSYSDDFTNYYSEYLDVSVTATSPPALGANMTVPFEVGTLTHLGTYSHTANNSSSNNFKNDIGNTSEDIYYRFTINEPMQMELSHCSSLFDTYLYLLDSNGNVITSNDDYGPLCSTSQASITITLQPGTYYVVSEGYGSYTGDITTYIKATALSPSISITASNSNFCYGTNVTFNSSIANGGGSPAYQWQINGINIGGATGASFSSTTLNNGDVITCVLTAGSNSAVSNGVGMTVGYLPNAGTLSSSVGIDVCEGTTTTISVSGNTGTPHFWVSNNNGDQGGTWNIHNNITPGSSFTVNLNTPGTWRIATHSSNDICGFGGRTDLVINVKPKPQNGTIAANKEIITLGQSVTISSSGGVGIPYYWSSNDGVMSWNVFEQAHAGEYSFTHTPATTGTYQYYLYNRTDCGFCWDTGFCSTSPNVSVQVVEPLAQGTAFSSVACPNNYVSLWYEHPNLSSLASVTWQKYEYGAWQHVADINNVNNDGFILNNQYIQASIQYRAIAFDTLGQSTTSEVTVQLSPMTVVAGEAFGSRNTIAGNNTGEIILADYTGQIINWQKSIDNGTTWTNISGTNGFMNLSYQNISQTTMFRAWVGDTHCNINRAYSTPAIISMDGDRNWSFQRTFDGEGNVTGENKQFLDYMGRPTQSLGKDQVSGKILTSQTIYNSLGLGALTTMAAPIEEHGFVYKENFITNASGQKYGPSDFESQTTLNNPSTVGNTTPGTLGWYYSANNTLEPYTPVTTHPYSLSEGYEGPSGGMKRAAGPGDSHRMGSGHEVRGRQMAMLNELDHYLSLRPHFLPTPATTYLQQGHKSVTITPDGKESISFTDRNGTSLASCLSGPDYAGIVINGTLAASGGNNKPGYLDIHIPNTASNTTVTITGGGTIKLFNLQNTDNPTAIAAANQSLAPGFYRIQSVTGEQTISYTARYGDFSYNFYDDAGRLKAAVAPKGVNMSSTAMPAFTTTYEYNTAGQLLRSTSTDEGTSEYVYRRDGSIRFSQSAQQKLDKKFSYTNYDDNGRMAESGEYQMDKNDPNQGLVFENLFTTTPQTNSVLQAAVLESESASGGLDAGRCTQRQFSWYDLPFDQDAQLGGRKQRYVLGSLAKTANENSTSWYSYDELGQLEWMVQEIAGLGTKTIDYTYNFSGNVLRVAYQAGRTDAFYHHYTYDANQRLVQVETSPDGTTKKLQAKYAYYLHGPLKRVELAENLQNKDYVYTIQGWLKSINHVNKQLDPGQDGIAGNNRKRDLFGMTLDYFSGDYESRALTGSSSATDPGTGYTSSYTGLIKSNSWQSSVLPDAYTFAYKYDAKNQLMEANTGKRVNGVFQPLLGAYQEHIKTSSAAPNAAYDAHGNILHLNRTNKTGQATEGFSYEYIANTNKLNAVKTNGVATIDYDYDADGQMIRQRDEKGQQYLTYDASGKVTAVYSDQAHTQPVVTFAYNDRGHRVKKTSYTTAGAINITTWYFNDADGNPMSIYTQEGAQPFARTEVPIYGAERVGAYTQTPAGMEWHYELTDHLGNVRVVFRKPEYDTKHATMEYGVATDEEANFKNLLRTRSNESTSGNVRTGSNVAKLNAADNTPIGPIRTLQVQKGDSIQALAYAHYQPVQNNSFLFDLSTFLASSFVFRIGEPAEDPDGRMRNIMPYVGGAFALSQAVKASLPAGVPEAYLKYIAYDNNWNVIATGEKPISSAAGQVNGQLNFEELKLGYEASQDGYVEVFVGNASSTNLYFDDIQVKHGKGMVVQENHYYAFGKEIPELQYLNGALKNYRNSYQGQFAEKDEETGWNSFELRMYDSRIGRWMAPDPYGQYDSPYVGMGNNPANEVDPDGGFSLVGAGVGAMVGAGIGYAVDGKRGAIIGAGAGFLAGGLLGDIRDKHYSNGIGKTHKASGWDKFRDFFGEGQLTNQGGTMYRPSSINVGNKFITLDAFKSINLSVDMGRSLSIGNYAFSAFRGSFNVVSGFKSWDDDLTLLYSHPRNESNVKPNIGLYTWNTNNNVSRYNVSASPLSRAATGFSRNLNRSGVTSYNIYGATLNVHLKYRVRKTNLIGKYMRLKISGWQVK